MGNNLFSIHEEIHDKNYLLATYYIELPADCDVSDKAASMATGQTIGTWVPVPGITQEMRDTHMGCVVSISRAASSGTKHSQSSGVYSLSDSDWLSCH